MPRGLRRHLASIVAATAVVVAIATVVPGPPAATNLGAEPAHAMVHGRRTAGRDGPDRPERVAARLRDARRDARQGRDAQRRQLRQRPTLRHVRRPRRQRQRVVLRHRRPGRHRNRRRRQPAGARHLSLPLHLPRRHHARHLDDLGQRRWRAACPAVVRPAVDASPDVAHREDEDPDRAGRSAGPPDRAADDDVDLRRHLPGSHHRAAGRQGHEGHLRQPAALEGQPVRAPARGPPLGRGRRATDEVPHRPGEGADLRLPAGRRRPAGARGLLLVPRPPDGRDDPQQLARPAGHVPRHGRQEREAGAALRWLRRATDGVRAQLRRQQPAGAGDAARDDDDRTDGATERQHGGRPHPGQRPLRAVPRRGHAPVPAPAAQHVALHDVRLRALRRAPVRAGRHRQRSAAQGSGAPGHPARAGPAGGRRGGLPQRARQGRRPRERARA